MKSIVAQALADRVQSGQILGIGSGSTVEACLDAIGKRIKSEKLVVSGVTTSVHSTRCAQAVGINVLDARADSVAISWAFDGADEIDPNFNLIKGAGGAMVQEKILACRAGGLIVVATEDKQVARLGEKFPVPVEVVPQAVSYVEAQLRKLGATEIKLRSGTGIYGSVVTEQGNLILDVRFAAITAETESSIKLITGVVDSGLFFGLTKEVLLAGKKGVTLLK